MFNSFNSKLKKIVAEGSTSNNLQGLFNSIVAHGRTCFYEDNNYTLEDYFTELLDNAIQKMYDDSKVKRLTRIKMVKDEEVYKMKMYICVRDFVPDEFVPVICAHSSLIAHIAFSSKDEYKEWFEKSFAKAVVCVNDKEWDKLMDDHDFKVVTESALDNKIVAAVFCPRQEWPKVLKFAKLWKPKDKR